MIKNVWARVDAVKFMTDLALYSDVKLSVKFIPNTGFTWTLEWKDADNNPYKVSANDYDLLFKKAVGMHISKSV